MNDAAPVWTSFEIGMSGDIYMIGTTQILPL